MQKGENQRSWKGQTERVVEPLRHRWQMESTGANGERLDAPLRTLRRTLVFLLVLSAGLLSTFVFLLLHSPIKTPLITVGATKYVWPMPPNSWVQEDVDGLASLHGKSIHWKDSSKAWQTKSTCLDDLRTQLRETAPLAKRAGAIVLYINMHGAVNEAGEACLIPPAASSIATTQWVKVEEIVSTIAANTPSGVHVLLAIDCVHQQVNWNVAQLSNTFVERLEDWATKSCPKSIAVLASCSSDQRSWAGADLHNSVFGRELRLGLAGQADRQSSSSRPGSGNGDGAVSIRELSDYLADSVDKWAQTHRGRSQTPRILPNDFQDFRVTWALKSGELARQSASVRHTDLAVSSPSSAEIEELWRSVDKLREMAVYRYDPKNWADLEQKMLWLEQLSNSGSGYTELSAKQVFPSLSKRIKDSLERASACINSDNEIAKANILQERIETVELPSHLPSLALQEYLGEIPSQLASDLRSRILNASIDAEETISGIVASLGFAPQALQWNELNFLGLAKKYDCLSAWPDHSVIQDLFELRNHCEQLAVQGDARGHRWRRPALLNADQERRRAEDQLILGPPDSLLFNASETSWSGFRMALSQIDDKSQNASVGVESILRLRDQGFSEVSYLANWICSPETVFDNLPLWNKSEPGKESPQTAEQFLNSGQDVTTPFLREELAIQELKRLLGGLHELSVMLRSVSEQGAGRRDELEEAFNRTSRDFNSLKALVRDHVDRASRGSADPAKTIREVDALLALPFLASDERTSLKKLLLQKLRDSIVATPEEPMAAESVASKIRSQLVVRQPDTTLGSPSDANSVVKQSRYVDRMRSWGTLPLGELILFKEGFSLEAMSSLTDPKANDKERELTAIDVGNSRLRQCYHSMQLFGASRVEDWCQSAGVQQTLDENSDGWSRSAFLEQFERAIATLCPIPFESNNALMYRRLAFKDLLQWYANRISDDFYAEAIKDVISGMSNESYFERAVKQVLDYAALIPGDTGSMVASAQATLEKVQALGSIARNGIRNSVKLGAPGADADRIRYEVDLKPAVVRTVDGKPWILPIPEGLGTLLVRNASGISKERRLGVAMPVTSDQPSYKLTSQPLDSALSNEAVLVYRGHEFRAPMSAGQGMIVDFKPNHFDWAELALFGDTKRQASIVFVLDCSWSMGDEIPVEAVGMKSQSRLELAKASLLQMITQIASRPDARIGVRLFGHRLGWSRPVDAKTGAPSGKTQILTQPNYPESIPDDLVPSRDVEAILPLGRFTADMVGSLANKLSKIVPWGQSPLYLSIIESFRDFDADDNSTAKSIVIITDGDNFQFNASGRPGGEPGETTSIEGVYRAWNSVQVPLFILGVGVTDAENLNARQNLLELAERTNGKYYDIENGSDLVRALSEQLSLGTFSVSKLDSRPGNRGPTWLGESKLNSPIELKPVTGDLYEVSLQSLSKTVQFQGGESLEMFLTEDGQDIVSKPYDRSSPRAATLVREGSNGRLIARVHRPSKRKDSVNFPISIQDPDNHFTPRPTQLWIEITPVSTHSESPRQTYTFYDANYEPKTPVPLVSWNASNWPATATAADVRIWAKYEPTPNLQSIPLEQVKQNMQHFSDGISVNGTEGIKLGIHIIANQGDSGFVVQITELHSDRSKGVGSIRVDLETDNTTVPSRVTRRFEPLNNIAVHTFEFEASSAEALLTSSSSRVTIQTRTAALEGAWQLQAGQAIRVEINSILQTLPNSKLPELILPR